MQNQKVTIHKPNIISKILHPSEYVMGMKLKDERKGLLNISAPMGASYEDILLCERMLNESSDNMSHVIKELPDCLRLPVALFYLYYKILQVIYDLPLESLEHFNNFITTDISNDIIPSPQQVKEELLVSFYETLTSNELNFDSIDTGKESDNELLLNIKTINRVYKTLPEYHQEIIKETISRIGNGMGEYSLRDLTCGTESKMDFEKFNIKIAGEFGVGLTKQFIGTNLESTTLNEQDFNFAAKLGTFVKKTNIITK